MTVKELRELYALAESVGGALTVRMPSQRVIVGEINEASDDPFCRLGGVQFWHSLDFSGSGDNEGWEFYSAKAGNRLCGPMVILDDGTELTIDEAKARAASASESDA